MSVLPSRSLCPSRSLPHTGLALLAAGILIAGCGNSDSPAAPADELTGGSEGLCPSNPFTMTPRNLEGDSQHTDVIRSMRADGPDIVFTNFHDVFRVPAAGGEPVRILDGRKAGIAPGSVMLAKGRFFLSGYRSGVNVLLEMPRTGTSVTTVLDSIPVAAGENPYDLRFLSMDDAYIYWSTTLTSRNGVDISFLTRPTVIHRMPWAGGPAETLATLESENDGSQRAGDRLLLLQTPYNDSDKSAQLLSLPISGGAPTVVGDFPKGANLEEADADYAYLDVSAFGLARVPLAGGQPLELLTNKIYGVKRIWADPDRLVIFDYAQVKPGASPIDNFAEAVFSLPPAGGAPGLVTCLDIPYGTTVHGNAKDGKNLYLSSNRSSTGEDAIFHITLP